MEMKVDRFSFVLGRIAKVIDDLEEMVDNVKMIVDLKEIPKDEDIVTELTEYTAEMRVLLVQLEKEINKLKTVKVLENEGNGMGSE